MDLAGVVQRVPRALWYWSASVAAAGLLFLFPVIGLVRLGLREDDYSHILLIPLVVGYLLWSKAEEFDGRQLARWTPGIAVAALAVLPAGWGLLSRGAIPPVDYLSAMTFALVLVLWGSFAWMMGPAGVRTGAFPLAMILFMIPLPLELLEAWVRALLWGSAHVTAALFHLSGVPFLEQPGYVFVLPGVSIQIAEQCSGIRSSMALIITGLLAGHFFLKTGWGRVTLVLLLFPLAVFKNGVRIVALTLLSVHVDPGFLEGDLHHRGGTVFFLITLALMAGIIKIIGMVEKRRRTF